MATGEGPKKVCDIAQVYVLDIPYHADKLYSYFIPPNIEKKAVVGALVRVPFGGANSFRQGIIFSLTDTADYKKLKPILSVSNEEPLLDEELMNLCLFLKSHTLCTFGEAVRSVVPAGAFSKIADYVKVSETKRPDPMKPDISMKSAAVYNYIAQYGKVSVSKLSVEFPDDYGKWLAPLVKAGYVERISGLGGTNTKKKITVSLAMSKEDTLDVISGAYGPSIKLRSPMHAAILKTLADLGPLDATELYAKLGCNRVQLASLEKRGLLTMTSEEVFRNPYGGRGDGTSEDIVLSEEQSRAFKTLEGLYAEEGPRAALLHGVTGSGKTSVIKKMIDRVRADGKGVIMLVPEIALTPQAVAVFCGYYGDSVSVLHSRLSQGERYDAWRRIRDGLSDVVIGTRSAIFAPLKNIGLIVIDEEQENTYKSDTDPKYQAHDVASYRCGVHGALMLLASATPTLVSYNKAVSGKYTLVKLKERYGGATLPKVEVCDMRREALGGNSSPVSMQLLSRLSETVQSGKQAIVFLNRRGYNSSVTCMSCGETVMCPECSVAMTYHLKRNSFLTRESAMANSASYENNGVLMCHYCGYTQPVPKRCPSCDKEHFRYIGCGTEKLEEELLRLIPGVKISRMDMDTTSGKMSHEDIIEEFRSGKTQILLGTQMVAKGHDFPRVTLVGVIGADSSLYLDDYRAGERTFSMLTQVIGRAGRKGGDEGIAVVQTTNPYSEVMRDSFNQDYETFFEREIKLRKNLVFPPFCDIAVLTLSSNSESLLSAAAVVLSDCLRDILARSYSDVGLQAFGPFDAPVYRVRNVCRMRMVLKCKLNRRTKEMLSELLTYFGQNAKKNVTLSVDFNPGTL